MWQNIQGSITCLQYFGRAYGQGVYFLVLKNMIPPHFITKIRFSLLITINEAILLETAGRDRVAQQ